jgi:TRAP-type C4-dicarboxylate transport system substrate-binding protein
MVEGETLSQRFKEFQHSAEITSYLFLLLAVVISARDHRRLTEETHMLLKELHLELA